MFLASVYILYAWTAFLACWWRVTRSNHVARRLYGVHCRLQSDILVTATKTKLKYHDRNVNENAAAEAETSERHGI